MTKDRLDKECALLEAQDESPMSQLTRTRTAHEMRLENSSKSVREVEHKSREGFELRDLLCCRWSVQGLRGSSGTGSGHARHSENRF